MKLYDTEEYRVTELMPIDTDCKFKCGIGYYMIGSQTRNCLPLSKWDGLQTACKRKLNINTIFKKNNNKNTRKYLFSNKFVCTLKRNYVHWAAKCEIREI